MKDSVEIVNQNKKCRVGMIHVAASRVFKRPKRPSAVDKAVGAVNINFPFSMQGQNRAEKVSSKALDRYSALLLARILREVFIINQFTQYSLDVWLSRIHMRRR